MSASLTTLALAAGAAFGSVVFIPPWLLYVKVVNDSVRKAEALLTKRRSVLLAEHEEIRQELMAIRPEEISTTLAYEERMTRAFKEAEQCKAHADKLSKEESIADWERDWVIIALLSSISAIPYFGYRFCRWSSEFFTAGISTFMANRMVRQLETKDAA